MDGFTNAQIEKQTIYEIYRACRLCGAGAGYKMPIIQNVVDLDSGEVELKQKVRECVQIEVHQDDKMPPLICELCVDKVNDFYEFLEMCRQTNKQTRLRLGLPPQTLPRGAPDAGDCILGVTEPIFVGNEDSNEPMRSKGRAVKAVKVKQEPESRESRNKREGKEHRSEKDKVLQKRDVKKENGKDRMEPRTLRRKAPSPAPSLPSSPPRLRGAKRHHEDDVSLSRIQKSKRSEEATPRSILKRDRDSKSDEPSKVTRSREKENEKLFNNKKVKIVIKKMNLSPKPPSSKPQPKPSPRNVHRCRVCGATFDQSRSLSNHMRSHTYKSVERKATQPTPTRKDLKKIECKECRRRFNHRNLLEIHSCTGKAVKPVTEQKPVPKPPRVPASKKKTQVTVIDPKLLEQLRPLQVRISKCDPLLENRIGDHYDASDVDYDYGLDKTCVYPYIYTFRHLRIKSEPSYMVNIQDEIKKACDLDDSYVHWDSDETDSDLELTGTKKVDTLISLSIKTLFSPKLLGKVPKRRRKVKVDKAFDSILNSTSDFDTDMRLGIDNIINSLGDDKDQSVLDTDNSAVTDKVDKTDTDSWFGDDNSPVITNSYFDSLLNDTKADNGTITCKDTTDYNKSDDSIEIMSSATNFSIDTEDTVPKSDISSSTVKDSIPLDSKDIAKSDSGSDLKETEYSDKSSACEGGSVINSKNDISKSLTDENKSIDNNIELKNSKDGVTEEVCKVNDTDIVTDKKDVTSEADNQNTHVNGRSDLTRELNMEDLEDVSESEMEDSTLMETLDKQIDGTV